MPFVLDEKQTGRFVPDEPVSRFIPDEPQHESLIEGDDRASVNQPAPIQPSPKTEDHPELPPFGAETARLSPKEKLLIERASAIAQEKFGPDYINEPLVKPETIERVVQQLPGQKLLMLHPQGREFLKTESEIASSFSSPTGLASGAALAAFPEIAAPAGLIYGGQSLVEGAKDILKGDIGAGAAKVVAGFGMVMGGAKAPHEVKPIVEPAKIAPATTAEASKVLATPPPIPEATVAVGEVKPKPAEQSAPARIADINARLFQINKRIEELGPRSDKAAEKEWLGLLDEQTQLTDEKARLEPKPSLTPLTDAAKAEVVPEAKPAEPKIESEVIPSEKAKEEIPQEGVLAQPTAAPEPVGAATPAEFEPVKEMTTSNKLRLMEQRRSELGLEQQDPVLRYTNKQALEDAKRQLDRDPGSLDMLLSELREKPRAVFPHEEAMLNIRRAELNIELERALKNWKEAFEADDYGRAANEGELVDRWRKAIDDLDEITGKGGTGTEAGRSLQARKMALTERFRLARMDAETRQAKGRELTPEETQHVIDLNKRIQELEAELAKRETARTEEGRKQQAEETHEETIKRVRKEKESVDVVTQGENIIDRMRKRIEEGDTAEDLYSYVQLLHENLQRQALELTGKPLTREVVVDSIHDILTKELGLDLPKEFRGNEGETNTSDLVSGIGRATSLTTDPAKLAKIDVRTQEQKIGKINRYLNKLPAPKTGPERAKPSAESRQLEKQGRELAREMGIQVTDPATQLANSLTAIKTRLRNEIEEIDRAIAGKKAMVKKSGGITYDEEATTLRKLRDEKKAAYDEVFPKEPLTEAQQIERLGKVLDRQIATVEQQLKSGEIFPPGKKPTSGLQSAALDAKRARLEALKLERQFARESLQPGIEKDPVITSLQAWRTRTTNRIAELKERLVKGDFSKRTKVELPLTESDLKLKAEVEKVKQEYEIGLAKDRLANRTKSQKVWDSVKRALGSPRQLMSSWDLSAVLRQGGFIAFGHPIRAAKALKPMFDALRSDERARVEEQKILTRPNYESGLYRRAKLYLAPLETIKPSRVEEVFIPSWAEKVWGVQASQRAYVTFLNKLRADSFDAMVNGFAKRGEGLNDMELKAIANYINAATGRGNLGKLSAAGEGLALAFFSPRLVASRFQLLAGEPLMRGSAATRRAVAEEYARFAVGLSVVYGLGALAGAEIEIDPRSSDFGKLKFGHTRVDPLMGLAQNTVLISRLASGEKKTAKGKEVPIRGKVPFGSPDAYEVGADWLRTKFSPIFSTAVTATTGKHPGGEPATPGSIAQGLLVPLSWQDVLSVMEEQGIARGTAIEILSLLGMGVQNYDEQRKVR